MEFTISYGISVFTFLKTFILLSILDAAIYIFTSSVWVFSNWRHDLFLGSKVKFSKHVLKDHLIKILFVWCIWKYFQWKSSAHIMIQCIQRSFWPKRALKIKDGVVYLTCGGYSSSVLCKHGAYLARPLSIPLFVSTHGNAMQDILSLLIPCVYKWVISNAYLLLTFSSVPLQKEMERGSKHVTVCLDILYDQPIAVPQGW